MQNIVDFSAVPPPWNSNSPTSKYFDIVGFDPRGVNNTTPALTCFPTAYERLAWNLQTQTEGSLGSSNESLPRAWARSKALGESCASEFGNGKKIGRHMNTTPVVRDIVAIIEALGEWR
jgi:pimeloyl-ACP methyl ester carboxylesterase